MELLHYIFKINIFMLIWLMMLPTGLVLLVDNFVRGWGGVWVHSYDSAITYLLISLVAYILGRYYYPIQETT